MIVKTEQYHIHTRVWGDSSLPPLLLLHGFLGTGGDWTRLAERLCAKYYVIAPDIPGHGETRHSGHFSRPIPSHSAAYSMKSVAETMIQVVDTLGIKTGYLCGYSMGARLALFLALRFPTRFRSVFILSGTAGLKTEEERFARREHDERLAKGLDTESFSGFLQFWYNQALFDSFRECPAFESISAQRVQARPHEAAQSLRGMGTGSQESLWDELHHNQLPITFVAGEKDKKFVSLAQELHAATPNSTLHIIANAGHVLHYEAEQEVYALINSTYV